MLRLLLLFWCRAEYEKRKVSHLRFLAVSHFAQLEIFLAPRTMILMIQAPEKDINTDFFFFSSCLSSIPAPLSYASRSWVARDRAIRDCLS
jgi:hypothetical protein